MRLIWGNVLMFSSWDWERYLDILLKGAVGLLFLACTILAALVMRDYQSKCYVFLSLKSLSPNILNKMTMYD